ncbi:MAG: N-acetylneuraminate synthase [Desulfovibrionaceae bacterium]
MQQTLIIAEAGVNHNGVEEMAHALIDAAVDAGADIVKFQTFRAASLSSHAALKTVYPCETALQNETQVEMLRKLELSEDSFRALAAHCARRNIGFLSTPFDLESVDMLANMGLATFKIPSGEIVNLPYLRKVGAYGRSIILSTGMSTLGEVESAVDVLEQAGTPRSRITLLHCTTEYPAPYAEVNLRVMQTLSAVFPGMAIGYSDHTLGIDIPIAAVALGAKVIEKHFTLDQTLVGPDHAMSLEPAALRQMVQGIRRVEVALGNGAKTVTPSELRNRTIIRKSIVAACPIKAGETLTAQNLTTKRPGTGISPMLWDSLMGTPAPRDLAPDELL